jgi:hypothetical protein
MAFEVFFKLNVRLLLCAWFNSLFNNFGDRKTELLIALKVSPRPSLCGVEVGPDQSPKKILK